MSQPPIFITLEAAEVVYEHELRKREEPEAVTIGPFNWVQLTYDRLRYSPDGDEVAILNRRGAATWWELELPQPNEPKWMMQLRKWSTYYTDIIVHRDPPSQEFPSHRVILTHSN